jgi:hypothetical protein
MPHALSAMGHQPRSGGHCFWLATSLFIGVSGEIRQGGFEICNWRFFRLFVWLDSFKIATKERKTAYARTWLILDR